MEAPVECDGVTKCRLASQIDSSQFFGSAVFFFEERTTMKGDRHDAVPSSDDPVNCWLRTVSTMEGLQRTN